MPQAAKPVRTPVDDFIPDEDEFIADDEFVPDEPETTVSADTGSFLGNAWNAITTPLDIPTRMAESAKGFIGESEHPHARFARNVIDFLAPTTPLDIGLTVGGGVLAKGAGKVVGKGVQAAKSMLPVRPTALPQVAEAVATGVPKVTNPVEDILRTQGFNPEAVKIKPKAPKDPNLNQGMGDPELAGSVPYTATTSTADKANEVRRLLRENPSMSLKKAQAIVHMNSRAARTPAPAIANAAAPPIKPPTITDDLVEGTPSLPEGTLQKTDIRKNTPTELWNFGRSLMTSFDLSAPGRQGLPLIGNKAWWTSWGDMVKSLGSENAYQASMKALKSDPLLIPQKKIINGRVKMESLADEYGLSLTDLTDLSKREEAIMSTWAEKIPGVRASNRAYTIYLNKLRLDSFKSMMADAKRMGLNPEANVHLAKSYAKFINNATGRGSLGSWEKNAVELNNTFFSPRLISSRVNMYGRFLNPKSYIGADPVIRKNTIKSLLSVVGVGGTLGQLARAGGAEVEPDPRSSDFGKIKVGNVRLDPYAGFQQYAVAASKLVSGQAKATKSGDVYDLGGTPISDTRFDVLERFGINKLHPMAGFIVAMMKGKEPTGQKFDMPQSLIDRYVPMIMGDLYEIAQEDPSLLPVFGPLSAVGMGTQVHQERK